MAAWLLTAVAAAATSPAASGGGSSLLRVLFVFSVLGNIGLAALAWQQASRIARNTEHLKLLLGQLKPLQAALPMVASWAKSTRDRREAYAERKAEALASGAEPARVLEIAEEAIREMDMSRLAASIEELFEDVGFHPPPLPSAPAEPDPPAEQPPLPL